MIFRCDCGNPLWNNKDACKRCLDLDGHTEAEGQFIEYLRDLGGYVSSQELADVASRSKEYTLRVLKRLINRGRVVRVRFDNDQALFCLVDGKRVSMPPRPCFRACDKSETRSDMRQAS